MDVDLFEYLYCYTCYEITQVSGSTPAKNCVCGNKDCTNKTNVEFGRSMTAKQKKDFLIEREMKKRNGGKKA